MPFKNPEDKLAYMKKYNARQDIKDRQSKWREENKEHKALNDRKRILKKKYNMTPEELSAKGAGGRRQLYNYVPVDTDTNFIQTPPDTYRPDKIATGVTIESLQEQRNADVPQKNATPQFEYQSANY